MSSMYALGQGIEYDIDNLEAQYGAPLSDFLDGKIRIDKCDVKDGYFGVDCSIDVTIVIFTKKSATFKNASITCLLHPSNIYIDGELGRSKDYVVTLDSKGNGSLPIHIEGSVLNTTSKSFQPDDHFRLSVTPWLEGHGKYSGTIIIDEPEKKADTSTTSSNLDKEASFTLRNGILFGDTKEDVVAKEKDLSLQKDNTSSLTYSGGIAGYLGDATFYFGKHGELTDLLYCFDSAKDSEITEIYSTIEGSCIRKYGDALNLGAERVFPIQGKAIKTAQGRVDTAKKGGILVKYDEWVVFGDDGNNAKIELALSYEKQLFGKKYYVDVSYNSFTQEELETILNEKVSTAVEEMNNADAVF